jgi:hypothetical protein
MVTPENTMAKPNNLGVINMVTFIIIVVAVLLLVGTYYLMR